MTSRVSRFCLAALTSSLFSIVLACNKVEPEEEWEEVSLSPFRQVSESALAAYYGAKDSLLSQSLPDSMSYGFERNFGELLKNWKLYSLPDDLLGIGVKYFRGFDTIVFVECGDLMDVNYRSELLLVSSDGDTLAVVLGMKHASDRYAKLRFKTIRGVGAKQLLNSLYQNYDLMSLRSDLYGPRADPRAGFGMFRVKGISNHILIHSRSSAEDPQLRAFFVFLDSLIGIKTANSSKLY